MGLVLYEYQLPKKDGSGDYYDNIVKKTTYCPVNGETQQQADERFYQMAVDAYNLACSDPTSFKNVNNNTRMFFEVTDSHGIKWNGYVDDNGNLDTVYPVA